MIYVTKLNDQKYVINSDLIEYIESLPDTTITMTTGHKIIVREPIDEILKRIIEYKKRIHSTDGLLHKE